MTSLVSIIIPTYNRASLIGDTIESLIHQTYHTIEIIIIDDHSTDNTEFIVNELIKKDKRISYHKRPINKPKGANACRNYGFSISKGEYVKWIDSDDVLVPEAIEKQLSVLINPEADLCICRTKIFSKDENDALIYGNEWGKIDLESNVNEYILNGFKWHTAAGLWKKSYFNNNLIWDEQLMNSQEWLMHFVQLCNGIKISKVNEFLAYARNHNNNMSNANNKKGNYYYHECLARIKAIQIAKKYSIKNKKIFKKMSGKFCWHYLFVYYKGAPLKGIQLFNKYLYCMYIYFSN